MTLDDVPDTPGAASRIFSAIASANILVDVIVQSASDRNTTDISFTIHEDDLPRAKELLAPVVKEIGAKHLSSHGGVAKLSVVGIGMRSHSGVAARLFECLGRGNINIELISTSEIKITVVIAEKDSDLAAKLTHQTFGLGSPAVGSRPSAVGPAGGGGLAGGVPCGSGARQGSCAP